MSVIESTYKSKDTEEALDKVLYRPLGYRTAIIAKTMNLTPNSITIFSMFTGIAAGVCFYFHNPYCLWLGIFFLMFSEMLDSADGQLARMTKVFSKIGRILDGLATSVMFVSIYTFLSLRLINDGYPIWIILIALVSLISHSIQCNFADFYRNCYLQYADANTKGEIQPSGKIKDDMLLSNSLFEKYSLWFYYRYAKTQESLTKKYQVLICILDSYGSNLSYNIRNEYKKLNYSNIKYYNILTNNTRMIALIIAMIINYPILYLFFEIIVLNILLLYVVTKQNYIADRMKLFVINNE